MFKNKWSESTHMVSIETWVMGRTEDELNVEKGKVKIPCQFVSENQ
jgi:hypothetical protein